MNQKQAALKAMSEWLADERELGRKPAQIACAGEFDRHGLHYYIFQYKKFLPDSWMLGVCGGYEGDSLENCGHVFSRMEPYDPKTAEEKAAEMVDMIREYWMQQAGQADGRGTDEPQSAGPFAGFVLLDSAEWDPHQILADLREDWGVQVASQERGKSGGDSLVWEVDGCMMAASLMPSPVPNREAEEAAQGNYLWPQAEETAASHKAHLVLAVLGKDQPALLVGQLFVMLCCACLKLKNARGLYVNGTVYQPGFYLESAAMMKEGNLPLFNMVNFGLYRSEKGISGYTYGMTAYGKDEIEVLDSTHTPEEVRNFLFDVSYFILAQNAVLRDGETIGFTKEQKFSITRSEGVSLDGETLKIQF
ncbi:DUF4261 domain-containing protein [Candidatus Soleaferrea massiliensis]|uniref:DUF4261 domain-containing protein n=1 Tax=Candidatus Soleaferrea massiliensis TaxID=1470354 RepID=UPI00058F56CC|nr:DUF4261 domain-containing protein [Candidatus Soleaferrea massiliensis]